MGKSYIAKGAKGKHVSGRRYKSDLDSRAIFKYKSLDDNPDNKYYGQTYTERQLQIINGDLPWEIVPINQISLLMNKAKSFSDWPVYEKVKWMREQKLLQEEYTPDITVEEARDILKKLTPD